MFSSLRKRFTYSNVALTLALVFAMTGGAYAAGKYVITSTKQIKPGVLASLKGANGKSGATGAQGPQGLQGSAGAKGETGPAGTNGSNGEKGEKGEKGTNGTNGVAGTTGSTGPAGPAGPVGPQGPLQSGKTETGSWGAIGTVTLAENKNLQASEQEVRSEAISFTLPVEEAVTPVFLEAGVSKTSECPGTAEKPEAAPGFLCVYSVEDAGIEPSTIVFFQAGRPALGASSAGTVMKIKVTEETGKLFQAFGAWAVTAK